jgi:hypothetical protein
VIGDIFAASSVPLARLHQDSPRRQLSGSSHVVVATMGNRSFEQFIG